VSSSGAAVAAATIPPVSERFAPDAKSDEVPDFRRHVEPLFGRLGCNGRACHGSFQGRGGFHLSLFGYDAPADHQALLGSTDGRVDVKHPTESLILKKPTLTIDHEGGLRYKRDGWEYRLLLKWIEGGAKLASAAPAGAKAADARGKLKKGTGTSPQPETADKTVASLGASPLFQRPLDIERLDISPAEIVFHKAGETVQLHAVVHWTDGTAEDVTPICRYQTNDDALAKVDPSGLVTCLGKGDTQVVAFYDNGITPVPVFLPVSNLVGPKYPATPTANKIDVYVLKKLRKLGVTQSPLSDDAEFLRRLSLDVTGTLPAPDEIRSFLADRTADKRQRKIDELLERPAYAAWWATRICDLTGNNPAQIDWFDSNAAATQWYDWMYDRLRRNEPYDKIVAGLLLANSRQPGQSYDDYCQKMAKFYASDKPADFATLPTMPLYWARKNFRKPDDMALGFCYTFLGVQMQCCQCHKHPFDRWTKQDFDEFSRFFTRVGYGIAPDDRKAHDEMIAMLSGDEKKPDAKDAGKKDANSADGKKTDAKPADAKKAEAKSAEAKKAAAKKAAAKKNVDLTKLYAELAKQGKAIPFQEVFVVPRPASSKPDDGKKKEKAKDGAPKSDAAKNKPEKAMAKPAPAAMAKLLGGDTVDLNQYDDPRQVLVDWLRANPRRYFARVIVNRVWANYFNVGIIQPTDDLNQAHPPSNPELLDYLTNAFVEHGYDLKWLHREILNSRTYQLSWQPNDTNRLDERNFSHAIPRRLPAEVAYDALRLATAGKEEWQAAAEHPIDRAIGLDVASGPKSGKQGRNRYALAVFGKPRRLNNCDCERSSQPSLLQTFFLENDQETLNMLDRDHGWLAEVSTKFGPAMTATHDSPNANEKSKQRPSLSSADLDGLAQEAYLRTLSREPQPQELARARQAITEGESPKAGLRDLLWALLNTKEFIVNH
jgi:hypothetical protein